MNEPQPSISSREENEQRAGATVDAVTFTSMPLGWIPRQVDTSKLDPESVAAKALKAHNELTEHIVRPIHNVNETIREARIKNVEPALADLRIEQQQHQAQSAKLALLERELADLEIQAFAESESLVPFAPTQTPLEELRDAERRSAFARMTPEQRSAAIQRPNFAKAVLGSDPELSGLTVSEQVILREAELASRRPGDVQRLLVNRTVLNAAKVSLAAAQKAMAATKVRLGSPKPPAETPPRKWR